MEKDVDKIEEKMKQKAMVMLHNEALILNELEPPVHDKDLIADHDFMFKFFTGK